MTLAPGARLGPYEILAPLGAGGMGEVYRARDQRLHREVAIKVLSQRLAADPEAYARFTRETRAVAALSHPNILALHDFGAHDGVTYAVMELLEGETLRQRLHRGPLPLRKAAETAIQIAHGLAAAHDRDIIHRDLKPENIFLMRDGGVKILDFGLAKEVPRLPPTGEVTAAITPQPSDDTRLLGTIGYMAPEQVRGRAADHRSDIFSLGAVLFEMVTGRQAFGRNTDAETMTAILREEPLDAEPSGAPLPPALERILRHCLEKNPLERFQSARDLAFALESLAAPSTSGVAAPPIVAKLAPRRWRRLGAALALLLLGGAAGALLTARRGAQAPAEPPRVRRLTYSGSDSEPSASPDGSLVAFTSARDGLPRIWIKQISGSGEAALTSGPDHRARFSPDGGSLLFVRDDGAGQSIYRISLVGGEPRKLVTNAVGADFSPDGRTVAFVRWEVESGRRFGCIYLADAQSGEERRLVREENIGFFGVRFAPDGRTIAVTRATTIGLGGQFDIALVDVETGEVRLRRPRSERFALSAPAWSGVGNELLVAATENQLGALSSALSRVVTFGVDDDRQQTLFWAADLFVPVGSELLLPTFDVLAPGRVVFDAVEEHQSLREVALPPAPPDDRPFTHGSARDRQPVYAPDGERVLFSSNRSGNLDLWEVATDTGALRQLTDDTAQDWDPAYTPDGRQIVWSSNRGGSLEIWIASADGTAARQVTHAGEGAENPTATRDGKWIVYADDNPAPQFTGIWKIHPDGSGAQRLVAGSAFVPEVSPDGRLALFLKYDRTNLNNRIGVVEIESGEIVPFAIDVAYPLNAPNVTWGRARWFDQGRAVAFVGLDEAGRSGIYAQDFAPGRDTTVTRRKLAGFSATFLTESFGFAPDGKRLTLSALERTQSLMLAEGVPGIGPARR